MEAVLIVDGNNSPMTPGPVPLARVPVSGDYIKIGGNILRVSGVLFEIADTGASRAIVKVVPLPQ